MIAKIEATAEEEAVSEGTVEAEVALEVIAVTAGIEEASVVTEEAEVASAEVVEAEMITAGTEEKIAVAPAPGEEEMRAEVPLGEEEEEVEQEMKALRAPHGAELAMMMLQRALGAEVEPPKIKVAALGEALRLLLEVAGAAVVKSFDTKMTMKLLEAAGENNPF